MTGKNFALSEEGDTVRQLLARAGMPKLKSGT